jgi:phage baseplate assembly protein V
MNLRDLAIILQPLHRRVINMVARAVVKSATDDKKAQLLQLKILDGEVKDDVERLQNYGFTSVPKEDAEVVLACAGGKRDSAIAIVVEDRRYRLKGLEDGEVAVYSETGAKFVLKSNGDVELTPKSGQKFKITGDVDVTGKLSVSDDSTFSKDVNVSQTLTASSDVVGGGVHLKTHKHSGSTLTTTATVSTGSAGTISGDTGAPD